MNRYIGEFQNNQKHGKGKFVFLNGDYWNGAWKKDQASGKGVYLWNEAGKKSKIEFRYKPKGDFDEHGKFIGNSASTESDQDSSSDSSKSD